MVVRAMDLFHVAIAIEIGVEALLSFDEDQITLAEAAGIEPTYSDLKADVLPLNYTSSHLKRLINITNIRHFLLKRTMKN